MRVQIKAYHAVAEWKWDLPKGMDNTCGICRVDFEGTCSKCKYPGDDCPIGELSHTSPTLYQDSYAYSDRRVHPLLPHALHHRLDPVRRQPRSLPHVPPGLPREGS